MANITGEILNKAGVPSSDFKSKVESTEKTLDKMVHEVGKNVGAMAVGLEKTASNYIQTSRDYVQENPAKSIAIAAAAGALAGSLLTLALRRRSHN